MTGASGYIGGALARRLTADGHEVRCLVRAASRCEALRALGATTFVGDLRDRASMREGMSGSDWVVHAAAELDPWASLESLREINVAGSDHVASLAYKLGVGRLLVVSSIAAFGGSADDGTPSTETSAPRLPLPSGYALTKREADEAIAAWRRRGLRVNTVYPSLVYGPPGKKEGANFFIRQILKERYPFLLGAERHTSWIYLADLVDGMLRLISTAPPGRDFLMTGEVTTNRSLCARIAQVGGVQPPRRELSQPLARLLLAITRPWFGLRGRRPPIAAEQVESLGREWAFSDLRARQELHWEPRGLDAGLPATIHHILTA
jgi:nucleoside-diphosphate-sugar epimerase